MPLRILGSVYCMQGRDTEFGGLRAEVLLTFFSTLINWLAGWSLNHFLIRRTMINSSDVKCDCQWEGWHILSTAKELYAKWISNILMGLSAAPVQLISWLNQSHTRPYVDVGISNMTHLHTRTHTHVHTQIHSTHTHTHNREEHNNITPQANSRPCHYLNEIWITLRFDGILYSLWIYIKPTGTVSYFK